MDSVCINQETTPALQSEQDALESRAACLVNPASGLANDYLNIYNEILLLVENLPVLLPEMVAELMDWRPVSYTDYFARSPLPGSVRALQIYETLNPDFKRAFDEKIAEVSAVAVESIETVRRNQDADGNICPDAIESHCAALALRLRSALAQAADLVNNGQVTTGRTAQAEADHLMGTVARPAA